MQFTENIVYRVREWRDRNDDEPDLTARMRRLWQRAAEPARPSAPPLRRRLFTLRAAGGFR